MQKYFQLQTHAVSWRHGGELSLFCWWSQKPDSSVIKHFNHSDQTAKQDIYTKLRVNILRDDQIKRWMPWFGEKWSRSVREKNKTPNHHIFISSYHHIFEVVIPLTVVRELTFINVIRKECWISWEVFSGKEIMMAFTQLEMAFFLIPSIKLYSQILFTKPSVLLKWHCLFRLKWNGFLVHLCCYHTLVTEK